MSFPTYKTSLLQGKAHRLLREYANTLYHAFGISLPEWSILGQLYDTAGIRLAELASLLEVEPPLITILIDGLEKKELVGKQSDPIDRRAKRIFLTTRGRKLVPLIEEASYKHFRELLSDVSDTDLTSYFHVLQKIVDKLT